ncbi:MAG: hypothetical protein EXS13_08260 [Planctomycetes bacterium]|nr:hypothetical protein [Planctomycetota bacterium]
MSTRMGIVATTYFVLPVAVLVGAPQDAPVASVPRTPGYEHFAPADSLLFLGIDSLDELLADWGASAYGRMMGDDAAQPVRDAFAGLLEALAATSSEDLGVDAIEMAKKIDGRVGVALGGDVMGDGDGHGVLALESSQHSAELHALVLAAVQKLVERGEAVLKNETIGAHEVVQVAPIGREDQGTFLLANAGTAVAVGATAGSAASSDHFTRFLQGLGGEPGEVLGQQAAFAQSIAAWPGGVKFFIDSGRSIRAQQSPPLADGSESPDTRLQRELGLDQLGALTARFALNAEEGRFDALQAWAPVGLPRVLMAMFPGGPHALFQLLPGDAAMALSFELDLAKGLDAADALSQETGFGPLFGEPVAQGSTPTADADAFDPRRDLLDHLDGRFALTIVPVPEEEALMPVTMMGGPSINVAFVLGVKNAAGLGASLDKLLRSQGMHAARRKTEFEGYVVYTLPIPPVAISYAIVDDFLVVSASPTLLQDVLRRKSNLELPSLGRSESFKANYSSLMAAPGILLWANTSDEVLDSFTNALGGRTIDTTFTYRSEDGGGGFGSESGGDGSDGGIDDVPVATNPVQQRADAFLAALEALDPALLKKYLPPGHLVAISCDASGLRLEVVAK